MNIADVYTLWKVKSIAGLREKSSLKPTKVFFRRSIDVKGRLERRVRNRGTKNNGMPRHKK